jgi:hypothetical protein
MKALAAKSPLNDTSTKSASVKHRHTPGPKRVPFFTGTNTFIQTKSICPCDGGCSKCTGIIQPKLTIAQPNDKYEQEADRVADQVMSMPEPEGSLVNGHSSLVQRQSTCPECIEEEEGIQTKPLADQITPLIQRKLSLDSGGIVIQTNGVTGNTPEVNSDTESLIQSLKGGGQPLSESSRSFFEPRFGVDFSQVRTHQDTNANNLASSLVARAFTYGNDIWLGQGESTSDKGLMAHELTHILQQNNDSRMIQAQEGAAASIAGLTARRTAFNNNNNTTTNADNCCYYCSPPLSLGVGVLSGAQNAMEIEYTISGTIPEGTDFDILRTVRGAFWENDGGAWARIYTIPAGTADDINSRDECLIPNRRRIFVIDATGLPAMNPRGIILRLNRAPVATFSTTASAFVGKLNFFEWVIARNRTLGIDWTPISQPIFTRWHSITSVALDGGTWARVNTPNGDRNEIELGTVNTDGNTP